MYLVQQKEVMDFNLKNILKYLGFGFSIFPIIIIFYLIFPRADINFKIFDPSASSLGIPDNINLGSFREFSNSEEPVFTLINKNYKKDQLYFRVKVFDYMEKNRSWRPTSNIYMYNTFKNHTKVNTGQNLGETYEIILEPYKGKWIPTLANSKLKTIDNEIYENLFNQTFSIKNLIDRKKKLEFFKYKNNQEIYDRLKDYYTLLPNTISKDLVSWAIENKKDKTDKQYLNTIIKTFADGSYFYNLSPKNLSGNSYADFFFNSKEGYCEYFAGTFVLLARLGGIPSRIVSGYLGGDLNNIGDFYVFRQKDAHAWAEVWFEREGWVKVDPTKYIPQENVRNTLNDLFNYKKNTSDSSISLKIFKYVGYYLNYTDFIWTQHLLSYDNNQRKSFINNLINFKFSKSLFWIFIPISFFIFVRFLFLFNKKKFIKLVINFTIWRLRKKRKLLYSDTHQQILNKFSLKEKNKYQYLFKTFEIIKYSNKKIEYSLIFKSLI
jgi:transglutaminase-like putative cysteine protease